MNEKPNTIAGGDVARPAAAPGETLLQEAKHAVGHMAGDAKEHVVQRVETQKEKAAEKIGSVAGAIRAAGEPLADIGPLPDLAGRAADQIESIAEYVQSRTVGDLVREVEGFARREPAIFLGAAFGLGLLAGRFLKSSPRREAYSDIQDDLFDEEIAFGEATRGRFETRMANERSDRGFDTRSQGRFDAESPAGQGRWGSLDGRFDEPKSPAVDRTMNSGFGGYGGSYATGTSTAHDTTGSTISAKPTSELQGDSFVRGEGAITKPMGTLSDSSLVGPGKPTTADTRSTVTSASVTPDKGSFAPTTTPMATATKDPMGKDPLGKDTSKDANKDKLANGTSNGGVPRSGSPGRP